MAASGHGGAPHGCTSLPGVPSTPQPAAHRRGIAARVYVVVAGSSAAPHRGQVRGGASAGERGGHARPGPFSACPMLDRLPQAEGAWLDETTVLPYFTLDKAPHAFPSPRSYTLAGAFYWVTGSGLGDPRVTTVGPVQIKVRGNLTSNPAHLRVMSHKFLLSVE